MSGVRAILQVSSADRGGGAEAVAMTLHDAFRRRGLQAHLAVGRVRRGGAGVFRIPQGRGYAWRLHELFDVRMHFRAARLARALAVPGTLVDVARGHEDFHFPGTHELLRLAARTDVLQLHNLHGGYFDLRVLPKLTAHVPTVATLHDAWMLTGHCAVTYDCERWTHGCGSCPYLDTYPALRRDGTAFNLQRKAAIYAATSLVVVTPSRWLMDMVGRSVLAPAATQQRVIPNGVDTELFHPGDRLEARAALGIKPGALLLVLVAQGGRANEFRDFPTLLAALGRLGAAPGKQVDAVVLGDPAESQTRLGRVVLRGHTRVAPESVATWFRAADACVHVARADTFPNVVLEALACGIPVVATAVGGIPEQVRPLGKHSHPTGLLVRGGDPAALAASLERILVDDSLRRELGEAAATDARDRFTAERQADAYIELYDELLEHPAEWIS